MAQTCDICGKGPQFGNNISHAHNVTKRRWNVNLQAVKALVNGAAEADPRVHQLHQDGQNYQGGPLRCCKDCRKDRLIKLKRSSRTGTENPVRTDGVLLCALAPRLSMAPGG